MDVAKDVWNETLEYFETLYHNQPFSVILATLLVCLLLAKYVANLWRDRDLPPGPICLPFIGYLPFVLGKEVHKDFHRLQKKYGPVFSVKLGALRAVVINDFESLKESGRKDEFSDRPPSFFAWSDKNTHMAEMNGHLWKDQRKFLLSTLRNVGMSNLRVEGSIKEQIALTIEDFKTKVGKRDVNIRDVLNPATNNVIMSLICGKTFDRNHKKIQMLSQFQFEILQYFELVKLVYFFPLLRNLYVKFMPSLRKLRNEMSKFQDCLNQEIQEHKKSFDNNDKADYIDHFLNEIKTRGPNSGFSEICLLGNSQIMLMAGSETIRSTIEWSLLCLARYQLVQEMVYKEIISVLGPDKEPEWKDRERLVLVQAFILEVMRWKLLVNFSDPHWTSDDVQLNGYTIPKNTFILLNLWSVSNDTDFWGDPENFRPERFLSEDLQSIVKAERVVPFGVGRRNCPGEKLADVEVFLFITALIQKFRFLPPENGVCMDEVTNLTQMVLSPFIRLQLR